jgi:hypothetical protein
VKELEGRLRESEAQLAAALGGNELEDPTSAANAALSAALSDAAGKDAALAEARSQCAGLQNQLRQAEYAARDAHAHASVAQAASEAENQQLRHRVQAAEAELARHSDASSLSQQLGASQDALAAVRAEVAGLSDELHVMRAAASASVRDADLVADAAAAHAKVHCPRARTPGIADPPSSDPFLACAFIPLGHNAPRPRGPPPARP